MNNKVCLFPPTWLYSNQGTPSLDKRVIRRALRVVNLHECDYVNIQSVSDETIIHIDSTCLVYDTLISLIDQSHLLNVREEYSITRNLTKNIHHSTGVRVASSTSDPLYLTLSIAESTDFPFVSPTHLTSPSSLITLVYHCSCLSCGN